jgi:uncharacterized membrane protein (UPF0127 family)
MGTRGTFLAPLVDRPSTICGLRNQRSGAWLAVRVIPALDSVSRRTGLLRHTSLPEGDAMVIAPTSAVHTFWMQFPIDIVFVTRDGRVLKTRLAVPAWRLTGALGAHAVIELAAGALATCEIRPGDVLELVPREAEGFGLRA